MYEYTYIFHYVCRVFSFLSCKILLKLLRVLREFTCVAHPFFLALSFSRAKKFIRATEYSLRM